MIKKTLYGVLLGVLGLGMLSSCADKLDSSKYFKDRLTIESVFQSKTHCEEWLAYAYSFLKGENFEVGTKGDFMPFDFADDMYYGDRDKSIDPTKNELSYNMFKLGEYDENSYVTGAWGMCYKGIYQASVFIHNVDQCTEMADWEKLDYKGQARFVRAYFYWLLLRRYGPVPIMPDEGVDYMQSYDEIATPRSSYEAVAQYISDEMLQAAQELYYKGGLNNGRDNYNVTRPTKGAALATRAIALIYAASPFANGNNDVYAQQLVDNEGNRLRVTGNDGASGAPGITPQFKIEDGRWLVSYDNGNSWLDTGQATGDQGESGITPQFMIEKGRWLISYDNGKTWKQLGQATGNPGITPRFKIKDGRWLVSYDDGNSWQDTGQATGDQGASGKTPQFKIEDGRWLISYDDGNSWQDMGQATGGQGEPGITPQFKIENGRWWVSVDNGMFWQEVGQATGDSFFKEIDNTAEDHVDFVFADGTVITIPKKSDFSITFTKTLPKISAGETIELGYTLSKGDNATLVKTVVQNGWKAEVVKKNNTSGTIRITAPTPITDDEVLVFISDGKEKTVMYSISFCIVIMENISSDTVMISSAGGNLNLEITSNISLSVSSPDDWIQTVKETRGRALTTNNFLFNVSSNKNEEDRTGTIQVRNMSGALLKTVCILQTSVLDKIFAREREALVKFYYAANGDKWLHNDNWCSDKPVGEWYGITTDDRGFVREITLSSIQMTGVLSPAIGELVYLEILNLGRNSIETNDYNQLTGTIPVELGKLSRLKWLNLSYNQFKGKIPEELGNLVNLAGLYLSDNQLEGSMPSWIGNLVNLVGLNLSNNQLSGLIPFSIGDLVKLTGLYLSNNQLSGTIPSSIGNLVNLTSLSLYNNKLSGSIPSSIGNLVKLPSLNLSNNQLSGSIPSSVGNLVNLKVLYLRNNQLSGEIPFSIGDLVNLIELNLSNNQLSGEIPSSIGNLVNLGYPDPIPPVVLDLSRNQLSGEIPSSIGNLKNLSWLNLSYNQLSGEIPSSIENMDNLTYLLLNNNQLSGIPSSIGNVPKLLHLNLSNNQLSGEIPSTIGNSPCLSYLDLSNNQLPGEIPSTIGNMRRLKDLLLSNNLLSGEIPSTIGDLRELRQLNLSNNQLSGEIPSTIGNSSNLYELDLSNNQLSGMIPPSIGNMIRLDRLYLQDNNLEGPIPAELANVSLDSLHLSGNRLQGLVPKELTSTWRWGAWNPGTNILPQQPGYVLYEDENDVPKSTMQPAVKRR